MDYILITMFLLLPLMSPTEGAAINSSLLENYELLCKLSLGDNIPVLKYRSKKTGVHVILAQVEGPIVSGDFTLATEANDDDGLPHTLEHLIFLGSEKYPYKGVLDLLANRCLASGTNAWTDTDHTNYQVSTAGSEGFLNLLPIYLDHLLYPTLTEAGFVTEVYHITGDAEDAGVVYSEMQARENSDSDLTHLEMLRELYPEPSGYRSETGGIMKNLRESTSNEKIRKYHADYYRPENLHLIITGQVQPEEAFAALSSFEKKILSKGERPPYTRPWESKVPALKSGVDKQVLYPSDTEDTGLVKIAWRGPSAVTNIKEMSSIYVLMEYLTYSSISPVPKTFVEVDDPLASEVYNGQIENSESCMYFSFSGVPSAKIDSVRSLLMKTLNSVVSGEMPLDLSVMHDILKNLILKEKSRLETNAHRSVTDYVIADALYGYSCQNLDDRLNKRVWYEELLKKPVSFWLDLLKTYFPEDLSVTIRGVPSIAEASRIRKDQEDRINKRKLDVGPKGLEQWANKVEKATNENEIPPPSEMLKSVPVPGISTINFHPITPYNNLKESNISRPNQEKSDKFNIDNVPVKFQLDHIHSNFVQLIAILDTSDVSINGRPYLPLLLDLLLESSLHCGEKVMPHEEVIKRLAADSLKSSTSMGLNLENDDSFTCSTYCSNALVKIKVDMPNYVKGVEWLRLVLFNVKLDADRIKVKANKLLNSIGELKRSGMHTLKLMHSDILFKKEANKNQINFLRQQKFLREVIKRVEKEPASVIKELQEVLDVITTPDKITVHMSTDLEKLSKQTEPSEIWKTFLPKGKISKDFNFSVKSDNDLRSSEQFKNGTTGFITGLGSVESAYMIQSTPSISEYTHSDLPALLTAIQYLTQLEGPMWKEIRGKGLAYNYRIDLNAGDGIMSLYLTRAAQPAEAYTEAINILANHINGTRPWEDDLLESARSSLIYNVIDREGEISDVLQQSLLAYYRKVLHSYNRDILSLIAEVTIDDVKRVALKYLAPLIDPKSSQTVIVCPTSKTNEILGILNQKHGHKLELVEDTEKSRFSL